jgi:hypothetical protein
MFSLFGQKKDNNLKHSYSFAEPENTACIVCSHVLTKQRPILFASHDKDDGTWQFLCGQGDHTESDAKLISLKQATGIDPSINALKLLPLGFGAAREGIKQPWTFFPMKE